MEGEKQEMSQKQKFKKLHRRKMREIREKSRKEHKCPGCGKKLIPATECVTFGTDEWDGHSFKCDCHPGVITSIG